MDIYVDILGTTGYYPNYQKKRDLEQKSVVQSRTVFKKS